MGYALIVGGGGENGRYSIKLDWGEAQVTQMLSTLSAVLAKLEVDIASQQVVIDANDAAEAAQVASMEVIIAELVAATTAQDAVALKALTAIYSDLLKNLSKMQTQHVPAKIALRKLKDAKSRATKLVAYYTEFNPTETRNAWCADFTTEAEGYVATLEIPGESDLILIKPGAPAWNSGDGVMSARELMSPAQVFFNAAILPGWQIEKPTYRWGTITSIDDDAGTANIDLFDSTSSAQRLPINQAPTLTGVPVEYMECGHTVFEVGDRVVVQFVGQDWGNPKVIGFLDNPQPCAWPCYGSATTGFFPKPIQFATPYQQLINAVIVASESSVEVRANRGPWRPVPQIASPVYDKTFYTNWTQADNILIEVYLFIENDVQSRDWFAGDDPPPEVVGSVGLVGSSLWFVSQPTPPPQYDLEFRISQGASSVFNAAIKSYSAVDFNERIAKSRSGILNTWGWPVSALEYDLISEVGY